MLIDFLKNKQNSPKTKSRLLWLLFKDLIVEVKLGRMAGKLLE